MMKVMCIFFLLMFFGLLDLPQLRQGDYVRDLHRRTSIPAPSPARMVQSRRIGSTQDGAREVLTLLDDTTTPTIPGGTPRVSSGGVGGVVIYRGKPDIPMDPTGWNPLSRSGAAAPAEVSGDHLGLDVRSGFRAGRRILGAITE